jgi:hemerythrin-like metal-binding protein
MTFHWSEKLSTGVSEIDGQHQALIQQINRLEEIIHVESESARKELILDMLDYLSDYARIHFDVEERQMETFRCKVAEENQKAHQKFLEMITELREKYRDNGPAPEVVQEIHNRLGDWFINHICKIDSQLGKAVRDSGTWAS